MDEGDGCMVVLADLKTWINIKVVFIISGC